MKWSNIWQQYGLNQTLRTFKPLELYKNMAKIEFAFPVDKVHGRLSRQHKIGFAHRTASKLNYSTSYGKRSTPVSDDEKQYRSYWGQVASAVAQRMKDPTKQAQDQLNFKNQNEYDTLRKYVWHLCAEEINN